MMDNTQPLVDKIYLSIDLPSIPRGAAEELISNVLALDMPQVSIDILPENPFPGIPEETKPKIDFSQLFDAMFGPKITPRQGEAK